jgi:hypothetical protein
LPGRARFAQQLDVVPAELVDRGSKFLDSEADDGSGGELLMARIAPAEHLDMAAVGKLEDPEVRFVDDEAQAKHGAVEAS